MENEFDLLMIKILKDMEIERYKLSHPFVGSEHLILALLKSDEFSKKIFKDFNVTYEIFLEKIISVVGIPKKNVDYNLYTPLLKRVLNYALEEASLNDELATSKYVLESLLEESEGIAIRILNALDVDLEKLYKSLHTVNNEIEKDLNFGKNLNKIVDNNELVVGREKEIDYIIETLLRKKKSNPLLIGDAGVGKTAIVEQLARLINSDNVPYKLKNSKIISVDMSEIVSGTKYRGEFEEKLNKIITTSENDENIILFIDEIHTIINAGGAEGAIGASDIFKPALARGQIKVIGATTTLEYNKYISKDKALSRRFENIYIKEPTQEHTKNILKKIKPEYEKHHQINISDQNINDIADLANKFIFDKKNPDKTIDFLDSVASYVQIKKDDSKIINKYLKKIENIKIKKEESVCKKEFEEAIKQLDNEKILKEKIKKMKNNISKNIEYNDILQVLENKLNIPLLINQEEFIKNLKKDLQDKYSKLEINQIYDLLTQKINDISKLKLVLMVNITNELIDIISKNLNNANTIKINANDYQTQESLTKLTGTLPGYVGYNENHIFLDLKSNPFSIIHIENFEKSSIILKNMLSQIKKLGYIIDSQNEKIYFNNSIIICSEKKIKKNKVGFNNIHDQIQHDKKIDFDVILECGNNKILEKI